MIAQPLDFTPGTSMEYSNYGTTLLSYVIANLTNTTHLECINKNVLGGADVELYGTAPELHKSDQIVQESQYRYIFPDALVRCQS
jgi:CubicO group peptidase (beta-lactamase class C family)